jgi:signal transduction histidine kinase
MGTIEHERSRLLRVAARFLGWAGVALTAISLPAVVAPELLPALLIVLAGQTAALTMVGRSDALRWVALAIALGCTVLALAQLPWGASPPIGLAVALTPLSAAGIGALGMVLSERRAHRVVAALGAVASAALVATASASGDIELLPVVVTLVGWVLAIIVGVSVCSAMRTAVSDAVSDSADQRRNVSHTKKFSAEAAADDPDAQQRRRARLLHDTVLATLTLLAHAGVGVNADALRQQAGEDARLLRQLRLGSAPMPQFSGVADLAPVAETPLGTTLESVKQRFLRMGLSVRWHGSGHVLLPSAVLDAFLLALTECLENVRRHAQVDVADVTISQTDTAVRAVVTDAGVGFETAAIAAERLGLSESVVARLGEIGGHARVFSTPGAGTTVILEVPR